MGPVIHLDGVTKQYGRRRALDDISFEIAPGTVFALLGENGAGKTTAIKIMLGLVEPDVGRSTVLGLDSRRQGLQIRRQVGYVPEQPTLYDWMTVDEIGWFTAGFYAEGFLQRYHEHVKRLELPGRMRLKSLSKGMRAKVVLSLALAPDPELLCLDEPTSGLDALVRREFLESVVDRAATGKTVFLSSHQIHEVERVADIVAILRNGKLLLVEPLERLKRETVELTVTLSNGAPQPPVVDGEILRQRRRARQWQVLARNLGEEQLTKLRNDSVVGSVEIRSPSLEEIFVAYMRPQEETELTDPEPEAQ